MLHITINRNVPEPVHVQIAAQIRAAIQRAQPGFGAGERLPPEHELAAGCGVNRLTLRKAIDTLVAEGLVTRAHGKGNFVTAPSPTGAAPPIDIGFLVASDAWLSGFFVTHQMLGAREEARRRQCEVRTLLTSAQHETDIAGWCRRLDGVVVLGDCIDEAMLARVREGGRQAVVTLIDRTAMGFPSVVFDEAGIATTQTRHLLELGHRRIAFLNAKPDVARQQARLGGYRAALAAARVRYDPRLCVGIETGPEPAESATRELLARRPHPTAFVVNADNVALGVMRAILAAGCRIPEDVSVISCGDLVNYEEELTGQFPVPLSSVHVSFGNMGAEAQALLLHRLHAPPHAGRAPERLVLPGKLLLRQSTAASAA